MKNLILILFVLFPVLLLSQTQTENYIKTTTYQIPYNGTTYSNYSYSNTAVDLLTSDFVYPGNSTVVGSMQINNNVLTVNFSGSWSPQLMRTGIIKTLVVSPSLPKIELGPILSSGSPTGYFAKIENNNLIVYSPFFLSGMSINTTTNLGYQGTNYSISTGQPMTCGGGGSGTISMMYGTVTLNVGGSWTGFSCTIKTGQIVQVPSTPNGDLGVIKDQSGVDSAYRAKIENGWLVFYATQPVPPLPSAGSVSFTQDLGIAKHDQVETVTYFDGLGRPKQQNAVKQSNSGNDIITHIEYDDFGRQTKEYLPFASSQTTSNYIDPTTLVPNLISQYQTNFGSINANPFSEKQLEASPLNRVLQQAAPGDDWSLAKNHTIKLDYQTNTATEVKSYTVTLSFANNAYTPSLSLSAVNNGFYDVNQLYKNITKDENWTIGKNNTTEEFKDKQGRVVLKRTYSNYTDTQRVITATEVAHDTYYVYDDYGNLTYVIPPLVDTSIAINQAVLNDLCYQYKYDYRNRLVEKKLPGKQWEFIVYDKLDRVVATGPAFSPFSDFVSPNNLGWMVTKYDVFNRPVLTAWMPTATVTSTDRQSLQDARNAETVNFNETEASSSTSINGVVFGYTNLAWPMTGYHILTINYYDNYNYSIPSGGIPAMVLGQPVFYNNITTKPKGLPTGSWTRVLETSTLYRNEKAYIFYDHKARPILNYTSNYLGGSNQVETFLDFSGKTLYTVTTHKRLSNSAAVTVREDFTYSDQNRLLTHTHTVNGALPAQLLASNTYDELGQLLSKNVGNTAAAPLQKVDYSYNIRGWMTAINNVDAIATDLFAFKINYNTTNIGGINPLYNGNIAETYWNSASDPLAPVRAYGYQYDNLNRLKSAVYQKSGAVTNMYNESLTYDKNGNIKTLLRNGNSDATVTTMDNLVYTYGANQLLKVDDSSDKTIGFIDGSNSIDDYAYDANGNMLKDLNKGIGTTSTDGITYNHLNLPTKIIFATGTATGNIVYLYNAAGQKVQKTVSQLTPTVSTTTTEYLGGFQYSGTGSFRLLKFFPTAEGYVEPNGSSYKYVYQYKDHLGNIRLSYKDVSNTSTPSLQIVEESNYYPFGLKQVGYNGVINSTNPGQKYKYNGKELQDELGLNMYDYGARNYDPALGRWMNVDPLAEKYRRWSPYNYCVDNPMRFIDPDGMGVNDVVINGPNSKEALAQLQSSVGTSMTLKRDEGTGNVTATNNTGAPLTGNAAKLASVIDDHSVVVNVNADNSNQSIQYGEAFMGNTVTSNVDSASGKNIVNADQAANTRQTASLDSAANKPGATLLHGVVEAAEGAKISQASGVSSPQDGVVGSVYKAAHAAAELIAPQPAEINSVTSYYGAYSGSGIGARSGVGLYLGNSSMFFKGIVPAGTVSVTTNLYANGKLLDK